MIPQSIYFNNPKIIDSYIVSEIYKSYIFLLVCIAVCCKISCHIHFVVLYSVVSAACIRIYLSPIVNVITW